MRGMSDAMQGASAGGETSVTFSRQLVRLLEERGHDAMLVSSHPRADRLDLGRIVLVNEPRRHEAARGLGFYRSRIAYAQHLAKMAYRSGAELAVIDSGTTCPFALRAFHRYGIKVAVNFHNVRWADGFAPTRPIGRLVRALDSNFFRKQTVAAMGCSPACADQVRADGASTLPYFGWTAQYDSSGFPDPSVAFNQVVQPAKPLALLFVGRVEASKGVFDLITVAKGLRDRGLGNSHITFCGDGSALEPLRAAIAASDVADMMTVRGRLGRAELMAAYAASDLVVVPTRAAFTEGMPLVCAEAMLAFRPVLTSRISNAVPVLGDAMMEAIPQDPASYVEQIERFARDPAVRLRLRQATITARAQFLDRNRSYAAAMDALIGHLTGQRQSDLDYAMLFTP